MWNDVLMPMALLSPLARHDDDLQGDRFSSEPLLCLSAGHKLMALQRVLAPLLWFSTPSAGPEGEEQDELEQAEG